MDPYHIPVEVLVSIHLDSNINHCPDGVCHNFYKADFDALNSCYSSIDWIELLSNLNIDSAASIFYEYLFESFARFVPIVIIQNCKHSPWMSRYLLSLKNRRSKAFKKYKLSGAEKDYMVFYIQGYRVNTIHL